MIEADDESNTMDEAESEENMLEELMDLRREPVLRDESDKIPQMREFTIPLKRITVPPATNRQTRTRTGRIIKPPNKLT